MGDVVLDGLYNVSKSQIYDRNISILKKFNDDYYKFITLPFVRKSGFEEVNNNKNVHKVHHDFKLSQSTSRSKARIFEYALCNDFEWFFTLTFKPIDDGSNRFNFDECSKVIRRFINNQNSNKGIDIKYILIPETHKNGAWHFHGLFKNIPVSDLVINSYGYLDWVPYCKKYGYVSFSPIRDSLACAKYITKYISKGIDSTVDLGRHAFYASHGLKRSEILVRAKLDTSDVKYDFVKDWYCKVKILSGSEVSDFMSERCLLDDEY